MRTSKAQANEVVRMPTANDIVLFRSPATRVRQIVVKICYPDIWSLCYAVNRIFKRRSNTILKF